jgi:hypothetical protein
VLRPRQTRAARGARGKVESRAFVGRNNGILFDVVSRQMRFIHRDFLPSGI